MIDRRTCGRYAAAGPWQRAGLALTLALTLAALSGTAAAAAVGSGQACIYGNVSAVETWLGRPVTRHIDFIAHKPDARGGWANYDGSAAYMAHKYPPHAELVVAVPIVPEVPGVTLQKAAQGDYQQHYTAAAQALARYGHGDAIVRIGWEFQGNWFPWGYNYPGQDKAHFCSNYKAAFRNVVKAFRGVSQDFKFDWNPALSDSSQMPDLAACYPGDDDVDMIGLDIYDFNYAHIGDPKQRFKHDVLDRQYGLEWQAKFAAEHHKPLSYPEWGAGGVGDNPYFIGAMHDWFDNHNVAYQCYWDAPRSSGYNGELSEHPAQRAMFQRLFGAAKRRSGG